MPAGVTQVGASGPCTFIVKVLSCTLVSCFALKQNSNVLFLLTWNGEPVIVVPDNLNPGGIVPAIFVIVSAPDTGKLIVVATFSCKVPKLCPVCTVHIECIMIFIVD